jgi:hypothetical protein
MKYIVITDTSSETFYVNKKSIAYLKETASISRTKSIYKVVLTNDKHIIIATSSDFQRVKESLNIE